MRSLRYPGLVGYKTEPGGGTTDYAVHIFHEALRTKRYECFLAEDTKLPMMYMHDALNATIGLMHADADKVKVRSSYNIAAMSFSPAEVASEIKKHIQKKHKPYYPSSQQIWYYYHTNNSQTPYPQSHALSAIPVPPSSSQSY